MCDIPTLRVHCPSFRLQDPSFRVDVINLEASVDVGVFRLEPDLFLN